MAYDISISGAVLTLTIESGLAYNQVYEVTLLAGISGVYGSGVYSLQSDYVFWFTSAYCPLFTTLTRVKLQAGPAANQFTDDSIYRLIHKNSKDAVDIFNTYQDLNYSYTSFGCTSTNVPYVMRMYVECKTAYDLLSILELANTGNGLGSGGQLKTLGDMTIRYDGSKNGASSTGDPNRKKQLYDCWMEMLNALKHRGITSAVRGWYDVSKQYAHPTYDVDHNRVIRTVDFSRSDPRGPWWDSWENWRSNI